MRRLLPLLALGALACASRPAPPPTPLIDSSAERSALEPIVPSRSSLRVHATGPFMRIDGRDVPPVVFNRVASQSHLMLLQMVEQRPELAQQAHRGRLMTRERVQDLAVRHALLLDEAERLDVHIDDDDIDAVHARRELARTPLERLRPPSPRPPRFFDASTALTRAVLVARGESEPSEDDLRALHARVRREYETQEMVDVSHILIRSDPNDPADSRARALVRASIVRALASRPGADFAELARAHSQGPTATRGGSLGMFGRGRMVAPFEKEAFETPAGEVGDLVSTRWGFHVLKVHSRQEEHAPTFEELEPTLRARAERDWVRASGARLHENLLVERDVVFLFENVATKPSVRAE